MDNENIYFIGETLMDLESLKAFNKEVLEFWRRQALVLVVYLLVLALVAYFSFSKKVLFIIVLIVGTLLFVYILNSLIKMTKNSYDKILITYKDLKQIYYFKDDFVFIEQTSDIIETLEYSYENIDHVKVSKSYLYLPIEHNTKGYHQISLDKLHKGTKEELLNFLESKNIKINKI